MNFDKLLNIMKSSKNGKTIGVFSKDSLHGEFCEAWSQKVDSFEKVDIGASIAYIMSPKEEPELTTIRKACLISVDVFGKYLKDNIYDIVDAEKVRQF